MIDIKTSEEIAVMREGGQKLGQILDQLCASTKSGMTTNDVDLIAADLIKSAGGTPSFLNYHGYPKTTCISIDDEVVHGIPSERLIEDGSIVGIDIGMFYKGFHTDTARTIPIGNISPEIQKLLNATKQSLDEAISMIKPGIHLGDLESKIQTIAEKAGFSIVRELTGHGVGRKLQEEPSIPNYGQPGTGPILKTGMTIAIEPMVNLGKPFVSILDDGWTIVTQDGSPSAHFEHSVAVTQDGYLILTNSA